MIYAVNVVFLFFYVFLYAVRLIFPGELGGLLGLYLGASLLTVVEFFDVILSTILANFGIYKPHVS